MPFFLLQCEPSESPATIAAIFAMVEEIREDKVVISTVVDGFSDADENDDYVAEEDFDEEYDDDDGKGGSKSLTKLLDPKLLLDLEFVVVWTLTLKPTFTLADPHMGPQTPPCRPLHCQA